jgi:hypothetical protein
MGDKLWDLSGNGLLAGHCEVLPPREWRLLAGPGARWRLLTPLARLLISRFSVRFRVGPWSYGFGAERLLKGFGARCSHGPAGRMDNCPSAQSAGRRISAHCVGPIAWDSTLGQIRSHFPTLIESSAYLEATPIVIWTFAFGRARVVASQQDDKMDPNSPADYWIVSGEGIVLPGGGILPKVWGDFRKAFPHGLSVSSGELGIEADSCQMPGLSFMLSLPDGHWPATLEPDSIPSAARVDQVDFSRADPPSDSLVSC